MGVVKPDTISRSKYHLPNFCNLALGLNARTFDGTLLKAKLLESFVDQMIGSQLQHWLDQCCNIRSFVHIAGHMGRIGFRYEHIYIYIYIFLDQVIGLSLSTKLPYCSSKSLEFT